MDLVLGDLPDFLHPDDLGQVVATLGADVDEAAYHGVLEFLEQLVAPLLEHVSLQDNRQDIRKALSKLGAFLCGFGDLGLSARNDDNPPVIIYCTPCHLEWLTVVIRMLIGLDPSHIRLQFGLGHAPMGFLVATVAPR